MRLSFLFKFLELWAIESELNQIFDDLRAIHSGATFVQANELEVKQRTIQTIIRVHIVTREGERKITIPIGNHFAKCY